MIKLLIVVILIVVLAGGYYAVSSSSTGILNNVASEIGISKKPEVEKNVTSVKPVSKIMTVTVTPTPADVSDAAIDQDLTALDKDLATIDTTNSNISKDLQGL